MSTGGLLGLLGFPCGFLVVCSGSPGWHRSGRRGGFGGPSGHGLHCRHGGRGVISVFGDLR